MDGTWDGNMDGNMDGKCPTSAKEHNPRRAGRQQDAKLIIVKLVRNWKSRTRVEIPKSAPELVSELVKLIKSRGFLDFLLENSTISPYRY